LRPTPPAALPHKQADKIVAIAQAANVEVEPIWASLLAKALEGKDVKELLTSVRLSLSRASTARVVC